MASFYRRFTCLSAKPAGGSAVDGPILVSDHLHSMEPCQQFRVAFFVYLKTLYKLCLKLSQTKWKHFESKKEN